MLEIPLEATQSQTITVTLANQPCKINIYQKRTGLYLDLYVNDSLVIGGILCLNLNRVVRNRNNSFTGDLFFIDTEDSTDPYYTGLGSRYSFMYLDEDDISTLG